MENIVGSSEEDEEEEEIYNDMGIKEEDDESIHDEIMNEGQHHQTQTQIQQGRRCRPKEEKERTKLRERHRRAITARILAGLRRHGNYNLRVRADINDVIGALAREAGWTVFPDGTTFPSQSTAQTSRSMPTTPLVSIPLAQVPPLQTVSPCDMMSQPYHMKEVYLPQTGSLNMPSECERVGSVNGIKNPPLVEGCLDDNGVKQLNGMPSKVQERDFSGTPYVPVFVMLPLGIINLKCELINPDAILKKLRLLKSINVDGVMVDCWWGIVEAHAPQNYNWNGYCQLFQIAREVKLKIKVSMSFHECGVNVGDDVCIPLPRWVEEIGRSNPDIYFTDRKGRRNTECLTWGIDKERVLRGRTAVEVYYDFMRSFRVELDGFFEDGVISDIEIGLGPCGELRYPSYPMKNGWRYPGIGEFQCYDQYLLKSLRKAAKDRGHFMWAKGPDNAGTYNSHPHETGFFCDGGEYERYYGRFFLKWYSQVLLDHADRVLYMAKLVFEGTCIAAKLSGIHWWYKTASHAAELIAGFYNPSTRDGYSSVAEILKAHDATLNFTCTMDQHENIPEAMSDPKGLVWQVLNAAWDASIAISSENTLPCYDRNGYNKILENAKPYNDPDGRHISAFTYLRLSPVLMNKENFLEFERFVKRIHGEVIDNQV